MEADERHLTHRRRWADKPVLRAVYEDYFERMLEACVPGTILELGGGSGGLGSSLQQRSGAPLYSSDLAWAPWLDLVADAQALPLGRASIDNIAMLDVLHHIADPARFFAEAVRVLRPGGRIVMIEPAITLLSSPFYRWLHPEPVDTTIDPLTPAASGADRDLYDGNQAIPSSLFGPSLSAWQRRFPDLRLVRKQHLSLLCYPLSGGYRPWSLVPAAAAGWLLAVERRLEPALARWCGFRLLVVIERC